MNHHELLQRCREGDELAWEVLVRQHQGRVCALAYGYVGNRDEALDLAQDIFVRVYAKLADCTDSERFGAWLTRLARNMCLDHLRRRRARPPLHDIPAESLADLNDGGPGPDGLLDRKDRRQLVHRALQQLSLINREMILLKDIQGLPLEEIASLLGLPLGTVKSRSSRARLELARVVTDMEGAS